MTPAGLLLLAALVAVGALTAPWGLVLLAGGAWLWRRC